MQLMYSLVQFLYTKGAFLLTPVTAYHLCTDIYRSIHVRENSSSNMQYMDQREETTPQQLGLFINTSVQTWKVGIGAMYLYIYAIKHCCWQRQLKMYCCVFIVCVV